MNGDSNKNYQFVMTNRKQVMAEGVEHVAHFDETEIVLETKMGLLVLKGQNMHITQLNLNEGKLEVQGLIKTIDYDEDKVNSSLRGKGKGLLDRILK